MSGMRFHLGIASKARRLFISSPDKKQSLNGENPDAGLDLESKPAGTGFDLESPDFGSKEETFSDSRAWLDSDCEDEFYSVNGDFTSSRDSTSNYQTGMPSLNKALFLDKFADLKSETSPTGRKRLADFLQETIQGEQVDAVDVKEDAVDVKEVQEKHDLLDVKTDASPTEEDAVDVKEVPGKHHLLDVKTDASPKSLNGTPNMSGSNSVYSSELTPNRGPNKKKEKNRKGMHCCLPPLLPSFSFNYRRQEMSPVHAASEKS